MHIKTILVIGGALLSLTACGGDIKSTLGMRKDAPDEFVVISNPPLKEPPEFNLNAPRSSHFADISEQGIISESSADDLSPSDKSFLSCIGNSGNSTTKAMIDHEHTTKQLEHNSKGGVRKTLSNLRGENEDPVIDPIAESARIKDNIAGGKPIHEGKVKEKSKSTLDRLFN